MIQVSFAKHNRHSRHLKNHSRKSRFHVSLDLCSKKPSVFTRRQNNSIIWFSFFCFLKRSERWKMSHRASETNWHPRDATLQPRNEHLSHSNRFISSTKCISICFVKTRIYHHYFNFKAQLSGGFLTFLSLQIKIRFRQFLNIRRWKISNMQLLMNTFLAGSFWAVGSVSQRKSEHFYFFCVARLFENIDKHDKDANDYLWPIGAKLARVGYYCMILSAWPPINQLTAGNYYLERKKTVIIIADEAVQEV